MSHVIYYDVIYRPGSQNALVEYLSRVPIPAPSTDNAVSLAHEVDDVDEDYITFLSTPCNSIFAADVDNACTSCATLTTL